MGRTLEEFRRTYVPRDLGETVVFGLGFARLSLEGMNEVLIPKPSGGDNCWYDHSKHSTLPAGYITGRLVTWTSKIERDWVRECLNEAGWISIEITMQEKLLKSGYLPSDWNDGMVAIMGKGLAYMLGCDICIPTSELGPYSLVEIALANLAGIPVVNMSEVNTGGTHQEIPVGVIRRVLEDDRSIWDHLTANNLLERLARPTTPDEETLFRSLTFGQCIRAFFEHSEKLRLFNNDGLVRQRLMPYFGERSYPVFKLRDPLLVEARPIYWKIDGEDLVLVQMFDFKVDNNYEIYEFWYRTDDGKIVCCQRVGETDIYQTVPNRKWVDNG